jgi:hypothetical protein
MSNLPSRTGPDRSRRSSTRERRAARQTWVRHAEPAKQARA